MRTFEKKSEMNSLITPNVVQKKLLSLMYPSMDVDLLMEVIEATPNPEIATQIMCGLYAEPVIVKDKLYEGIARTLVSYNKWNDTVEYSYQRETTVSAYFPKEVDKKDITLDNYKELACHYDTKDCYSYSIKTGKFETRTDNITLNRWNKYEDNNFELSSTLPKHIEDVFC